MAPTFRRGFPTTFALVIAALIMIVGIQLLALREQRKKGGDAEVVGSVGESRSELDRKEADLVEVRRSREIDEGAGDRKEKL